MWFQSLSSLGFALALPVIVGMYLLRRTYIDTPVASHLLWRRALREQEANRPWQRLRNRLLLWLQLAAAALLVLALMGPVVEGQAAADSEVVVVLDTSASMTAMGASGVSLLEEARASLSDWLEERGSRMRVTLIVTGEDPKVETAGSPRTVIEALGGIRPHFGQTDIAAALTLADATLRGAPDGEIVFVTDDRSGASESARVNTAKPLRVLSVPAVPANTAVAAFGVRGNAEQTGRSAVVTLINEGNQPASGTLTIEAVGIGSGARSPDGQPSVDRSMQSREPELSTADQGQPGEQPAADYPGQSRDEQPNALDLQSRAVQQAIGYRLQPGEQRTFRADLPMDAVYYRASIVSASGDRYAADDTAYAVGEAAAGGQRRALLVGSGNLFLDKALKLAGVQIVGADARSFEPDEDTRQSIDWVLLDGDVRDADIATEAWRRLLAAKPVWRIRSAGAGDDGATAGDRKTEGEFAVPGSGEVIVSEHPVSRYLAFQDVHFAKLAKTGAEAVFGDPVVTVGGVPAIFAGVENGKPGIVFAFDLRDTDLPLRPEFPILIAQAADWMSGGMAGHLGQAVAGRLLDIQHRTDSVSSAWVPVETLAGYGDPAAAIRGAVDEAGLPAGEQTVPGVPGLYRYVEYDGEGNASSGRLLAVTADPREGRGLQRSGSETGNDGTNSETGDGGSDNDAGAEQGNADGRTANGTGDGTAANSRLDAERLPLTPWLAALLLLFLAAEWEVYRRGFAR